jgi:hypothetical protein
MKTVTEESGEPLGAPLPDITIVVYVLEWAVSLAANLLAINRLGKPAPDEIIAGACRGEVLQLFRDIADRELGSMFKSV